MRIHLLHRENVEGEALYLILKNEGLHVSYYPEAIPSSADDSSFLLIDTAYLSQLYPKQLSVLYSKQHKTILLGELDKLHYLPMFQSKTKGFISKKTHFAKLISHMKQVTKNDTHLGKNTQKFLGNTTLKQQISLLQQPLRKTLTKTELKIMRAISLGKRSREIADTHFRSIHTVNKHRKNIKNKFNSAASFQLQYFCILHRHPIHTLLLLSKEQLLKL